MKIQDSKYTTWCIVLAVIVVILVFIINSFQYFVCPKYEHDHEKDEYYAECH